MSESGGGAVDGDTYVTPRTYDVARHAVGALLSAADEIAAGRARNAFCAVRPPGHHASRERAMGFCLFNQVAVAARYLQARTAWKRVLIVDFDVHHGNGTQDVFYRDDSVFYLSVHRDPFYPGTGAASERGSGTTLNLPFRHGTPRRPRSWPPTRRRFAARRASSGRTSSSSPRASTPTRTTRSEGSGTRSTTTAG